MCAEADRLLEELDAKRLDNVRLGRMVDNLRAVSDRQLQYNADWLARAMRAEARVAELEGRNLDLTQQHIGCHAERDEAREIYKGALSTAVAMYDYERARAARLAAFVQHRPHCTAIGTSYGVSPMCRCGLAKALAETTTNR